MSGELFTEHPAKVERPISGICSRRRCLACIGLPPARLV